MTLALVGDTPETPALDSPVPRLRRKSAVGAGDDNNDNDDNDDDFGDDFDDFEEGGEDDDFGDFDDGFQQAEADAPPPASTAQPQASIPSFVCLGLSLYRIYYTNTDAILRIAYIRS